MSRRGRDASAEVDRIPVPSLGTTWYERGPAYWLRRVWFAAMLLVALVVALLFVGGLVSAAWESHPAAGATVGSVIAVNGLVSGAWLWRRSTPKAIEERARAGGVSLATPGAGVSGGVLGAVALSGNMLAVAIVVVGASLMLGVFVVLLLRCLGPQLPQERAARVLLLVPLRGSRGQP